MLTVGVPVYNAEKFIARCLENLCEEDLDYRIVISDNASTDKTEEICREFAARDARIRYIRQESNIGVEPNFSSLLKNADTELFAWRAYDDLSSPGYFKTLATGLENNKQCHLAVGSLGYESDDGGAVPSIRPVPATLPSDAAQCRKLLLRIAEVNWFYGVFRRDVLLKRYIDAKKTYHFVWSFDPLLILPFLLEGSVYTDPGVCFTQYICDGSASRYRPRGVIGPARLASQFCRHGFSVADELATSFGHKISLYKDVVLYANSHGGKFSRIAKRALFWPYYRLANRL
jgi:glycosyltransferase involved in cell wall biosynthesis